MPPSFFILHKWLLLKEISHLLLHTEPKYCTVYYPIAVFTRPHRKYFPTSYVKITFGIVLMHKSSVRGLEHMHLLVSTHAQCLNQIVYRRLNVCICQTTRPKIQLRRFFDITNLTRKYFSFFFNILPLLDVVKSGEWKPNAVGKLFSQLDRHQWIYECYSIRPFFMCIRIHYGFT